MKAAWSTAPGRGGYRAAAAWVSAGRIAFGTSLVGLGILQIAETGMGPALGPVPQAWSLVATLFLVKSGLAAAAARHLRLVCTGLAAWWLASLISVWLPLLAADPQDGGALADAFRVVALLGGSLLLAAHAAREPGPRRRWFARADMLARAGRICFGIALVIFGLLHLVYNEAIASLIPSWVPLAGVWPFVTGTIQLAAGVSLAGAGPRLFAPGDALAGMPEALVGGMYATWVLLLHLPAVAANADDAGEWSALLMATALSALAVLFAVQARTGVLPRSAAGW